MNDICDYLANGALCQCESHEGKHVFFAACQRSLELAKHTIKFIAYTDTYNYWVDPAGRNLGTVGHLNYALGYACGHNQPAVADWLVSQGAYKFEDALMVACDLGCIHMAEYCARRGAKCFDRAWRIAIQHGNLGLAEWALQSALRAERPSLPIVAAGCDGQSRALAGQTKNSCSIDFNDALKIACEHNQYEMVEWILEQHKLYGKTGDIDFTNALIAAYHGGKSRMVEWVARRAGLYGQLIDTDALPAWVFQRKLSDQ